MKRFYIAGILIVMGAGAIFFLIHHLSSSAKPAKKAVLVITQNGLYNEVKDTQEVIALLEQAANSNDVSILNRKVSEKELRELKKTGIQISKHYAQAKELPVAGYSMPMEVEKIVAVITDDIQWAIVYLQDTEVVLELEKSICDGIKSYMD